MFLVFFIELDADQKNICCIGTIFFIVVLVFELLESILPPVEVEALALARAHHPGLSQFFNDIQTADRCCRE